MPGIAELALGAAPIAGGALLGAAAGTFKGPDVRAIIIKDMDLLERIPDDRPDLKARLKASIDERINDLIAATREEPGDPSIGGVLSGQLARHCRLHLRNTLHHHLVERQPQQVELASHVHRADRVVDRCGYLRGAAASSGRLRRSCIREESALRPTISSGTCPTARGCEPGRRRRRTRTPRCRTPVPNRGSCWPWRCAAGLSRCGSRRRRARTRRKTLWPS